MLTSAGHSQAAPRTPDESPCRVAQHRRGDHVAEHVAPHQRAAAARYRCVHVGQPAAQHDHVGVEQVRPPAPARAPAGRHAGPAPPARAASPAAARAGMPLASCAPGPSQSRASAGAGDQRLQAAPLAAPAMRARGFPPASARAAGCGPTRRRCGAGRGTTRPSTTMPPPQPVPMMTPNTVRQPGARAVRRLGQREAVGVVLDPHLAAERRARCRGRTGGRSARSSWRS